MELRIQPFDPSLLMPTVRMWRAAFELAMGLPITNGPDANYESQAAYLASQVGDAHMTHVLHPRSPRVLGFMAQKGPLVEHLYLNPGLQRRGVGSRLLALARQRSPNQLRLFTFQANRGARAFYRAQGFTELKFGRAALENNPWASSPEQLDDVLLQWQRAS